MIEPLLLFDWPISPWDILSDRIQLILPKILGLVELCLLLIYLKSKANHKRQNKIYALLLLLPFSTYFLSEIYYGQQIARALSKDYGEGIVPKELLAILVERKLNYTLNALLGFLFVLVIQIMRWGNSQKTS